MKEIGILEIIWELEFWKLNLGNWILEIKFERNWNFGNYLRIGVLKIKFRKLNFGNQIWKKFESWKLNLKEIGILEIIWKLEFWKLNLRIGVSEIKFERNWNFENYLRIEILKIKFKNWRFGN